MHACLRTYSLTIHLAEHGVHLNFTAPIPFDTGIILTAPLTASLSSSASSSASSSTSAGSDGQASPLATIHVLPLQTPQPLSSHYRVITTVGT